MIRFRSGRTAVFQIWKQAGAMDCDGKDRMFTMRQHIHPRISVRTLQYMVYSWTFDGPEEQDTLDSSKFGEVLSGRGEFN